MINAHSIYSYEFFKQWFHIFLLINEDFNEVNKREYEDLLTNWSNQFIKFHEINVQILMNLDELIEAFTNQQCQSIFIQHMIDVCFRQSKSNIHY